MPNFIEFFTNLEHFLEQAITYLGPWIYLFLFVVIFCETGLVVTPFLPGDSLLFLMGMFAAKAFGGLSLPILLVILIAAAVGGDTVNYWIGHLIGPKIFHKENVRFLNKEHLMKAHAFYEKYGGVTIIVARFMPIIRTFAPFVAGIGSMTYWKFLTYNVVGGVLWILGFVMLGYFIGGIPFVKSHLILFTAGIVVLSILPMVIGYFRHRKAKASK